METELFSSNYSKVVSLLLFLNLLFPTNVLLAFYTALITACRQNDGMSACKKFPGSKGQIKELPFFSDQMVGSASADTQFLTSERT